MAGLCCRQREPWVRFISVATSVSGKDPERVNHRERQRQARRQKPTSRHCWCLPPHAASVATAPCNLRRTWKEQLKTFYCQCVFMFHKCRLYILSSSPEVSREHLFPTGHICLSSLFKNRENIGSKVIHTHATPSPKNSFFLMYFLIGGKFPYSVVLVSAIQQCKSATIIYLSPPSCASIPSPHPTPLDHQSARLDSLCYIATSNQLSV